MRNVVYSAAMSLDGYIAGPKGESDWIVMDPELDFGAIFARFDTILLGRKTYEATRTGGGGGMPGVKSYVFSRTLQPTNVRGATVSDDPAQIISALKAQPGKDIWLFGGGVLFRSLLELGLSIWSESQSSPCYSAAACRCCPTRQSVQGCGLSSTRSMRQRER